jgi:hypothetical protein
MGMVREQAKDDLGAPGLKSNGNGIDECLREELAIFLHIVIWNKLTTCWLCQEDYDICLPLICLQIGCANLLKLVSAEQFTKID